MKINEYEPKVDVQALQELANFSAATIHEAQGRWGAVSPQIKPLDASMTFCGVARTVLCYPGDNLTVQAAIDSAHPGEVIVVNAGGSEGFGLFGDVLATGAQTRGVVAFITDSGVRDSADICALGLPVFSGSVSINGTVKDRLGYVNVPVSFGGTIIAPGDVVCGDSDGVVVVDPSTVSDVVRACKEREENEERIRSEYLPAGRSILSIGGLSERFERLRDE